MLKLILRLMEFVSCPATRYIQSYTLIDVKLEKNLDKAINVNFNASCINREIEIDRGRIVVV